MEQEQEQGQGESATEKEETGTEIRDQVSAALVPVLEEFSALRGEVRNLREEKHGEGKRSSLLLLGKKPVGK